MRGHEISWTGRSLIATAVIALCALATALSATASVKKSQAARVAEAALADEARVVEELARFLADETSNARAALDGPRLKPAPAHGASAAQPLLTGGFDASEIETAQILSAERRCLAQAIYYEARSESRVGRLAVADVVLNRVASRVYPDSICGVVFQGSERRTGCQFSFTCDGSMKARLNMRRWEEAELLAGAIMAGLRVPVSRDATHYHADYVDPPWAQNLTPTATIGTHKFYRFPKRRETSAAPSAM